MKHLGIALSLVLVSAVARASPKDRVESAARIYPAVFADWEAADDHREIAKSTLADVHAWSVRWLEAELALPVRGAALRQAFSDHLARMTQVVAAAKLDADAGLIGSDMMLDEATFFRAEAERWRTRGRIL